MLAQDQPRVRLKDIVDNLVTENGIAIFPEAESRLRSLADSNPDTMISQEQLLKLLQPIMEGSDPIGDGGRQDDIADDDIRNTSLPNGMNDTSPTWSPVQASSTGGILGDNNDGYHEWLNSPSSRRQQQSSSPRRSSSSSSFSSIQPSPIIQRQLSVPIRNDIYWQEAAPIYIPSSSSPPPSSSIISPLKTPQSNRKQSLRIPPPATNSPFWGNPSYPTDQYQNGDTPSKLEHLSNTISDLTRRLHDTETLLQRAHTEQDERVQEYHTHIESLTLELSSKKRECSDLKNSERGLQSQIDTLEGVIEKLNIQVVGLKSQVREFANSIKGHEEALRHRNEIEDKLREMLDKKEDEISQGRASVDEAEREMMRAIDEMNETRANLESLQSALSRLEYDLEGAHQLNSTLTDRIADLEGLLSDAVVSQPLRTLSTELGNHDVPVRTVECRAASSQTHLDSNTVSIQTDDAESKDTRGTGSSDHDVDARYRDLQDRVARQQVELKQLGQVREALQVLESQRDSLKKQIEEVETSVKENRQTIDRRKHYDAELERWMTTLRHDVKALQGTLGGFRDDVDSHAHFKGLFQEALVKLESEREHYVSLVHSLSDTASNISTAAAAAVTERQKHPLLVVTREVMAQTDEIEEKNILPEEFDKWFSANAAVAGGNHVASSPSSIGSPSASTPSKGVTSPGGSISPVTLTVASSQNGVIKPVREVSFHSASSNRAEVKPHILNPPTYKTNNMLSSPKQQQHSISYTSVIVAVLIAWICGIVTSYIPGILNGELYGDGLGWTLANFVSWLDVQLAGSEARVVPT
ncbi:hypothetical protein SmJEL517_g03277 [Synchytrium microbalum]|uniref:Uncharacterized protein n=1 Tax=Synchytrium microbalum TaxID=1806994 RepID=A0A507BXN1_9FUNG|nr:uncharacterized protein SmJEL517_g03277 [Synchytrium microbalum]TPX34080.1 hypothetical protein SmJEL517_g03277 [Synchytrium microbalum]